MMIGCKERTKWRRRILERPDQIPHRHRTKSVGPGTLKPGTSTEFRSGPTKCPIGYIFGFGAGPVGLKFACHTMVTSKYQHQIFATTTLDAIPDLVVTSEYFILEFLFSLNNFGPNVLDGRIWEVRTRRKQSL